jgi:hypothetical protein
VAAFIDGSPIICGGFSDYRPQDSCYRLRFGEWLEVNDLS